MAFDSPELRALRARLGAHALHASHDSRELTKKARATFLAKFEVQVDPNGTLTPFERDRRARHARKAYFLRLALKSAAARKGKTPSDGTVGPNKESAAIETPLVAASAGVVAHASAT
jgi:hypothetical protein